MVLQLHIYGPAFGLPSIDVECLAAIIYFQQCLPQDSWTIIASNDSKRNPFHHLPAVWDGDQWVAGYQTITRYLEDQSYGEWTLDKDLTPHQRAVKVSLLAFLKSRGQPLIDVSLYVSSANYANCTRPAWSNLLSWPLSWTAPNTLRDKARVRSVHLGLSALDVDAAEEKDKKAEGLSAHIPKSLRKPKQTVSSILGQSVKATRFRLDAVADDFLEPLQARLGKDEEWLVSGSCTSADCLAIAYLVLMQTPELPQSWLRDALTGKYAKLGSWAAKHGSVSLSLITVENSVQTSTRDFALPWSQPEEKGLLESVTDAAETLVNAIPLIRAGYQVNEVRIPKHHSGSEYKDRQLTYVNVRKHQALYSQIVTGCIGTISAVAWLYHLGILVIPRWVAASPSRNFGEAGMLLGLR